MPKVSVAYKEERRNQLLDSALFCFAQKGFEATTIDDIVKQAGVSKGAVYHYFKSKDEIYLELIETGVERFVAFMNAAFEPAKTTTEKLQILIQTCWDTDRTAERRNTMFVLLEFWIFSARQPKLRDMIPHIVYHLRSLLIELIDEGKQRGEFRSDVDSKRVATLFWAFRNGIGLNLFQLHDLDEQQRSWQDLEQVILKYLT
jgi:AcrR family transcriptional regulator